MAEEEAQAQPPELINPALAAKQAEALALQKAMDEIAATHKPVNLPAEEEIRAELAKREEEQEGEEEVESEEGSIEETTEEATEEASTEETTEEPKEGKKEEEEPEERTYTVKVNGVEKEVGEKELIRGFQKSEAADEKFQEAAKMREVFNSVAERIGQDIFGVAMDFFVGKDKLDPQSAYVKVLDQAKKIVVHDWNVRNMPAEERQKYEEGLELERLRKENETLRQTREREYKESAIAKETDRLLFNINKAIKSVGLPEDELTVSDIAYKMQVMRAAGLDPTPQDAAEEYQKDLEARRDRELRGLSPDVLIQRYPEIAEKVSKVFSEQRIAKTKEAIPKKGKTSKAAPSPKKEKASKPKVISTGDFMEMIRSRR